MFILKKYYHLQFLMLVCVGALHAQQLSLVFPKGFEKGVAFSGYQNGGACHESNWGEFEKKKIRVSAKTCSPYKPVPSIAHGQRIQKSAHFYEHAFEDIQLIKNLGCTSVRFSVEWADIEPEEGVFDYEHLAFWRSYCQELLKNGITPMITLYHWVHPLWFEKKGAFERAANSAYFVRYCQVVFKHFGDLVPLWCTINEPTVITGCGYLLGIHAPGKFLAIRKAGIVLRNLLVAHVQVYKALKQMEHGDTAQIGFAHAMLLFESYKHDFHSPFGLLSYRNPIGTYVARMMNFAFGHSIVKRFFQTGEFDYSVPGICSIKHTVEDAPASLDFFGLNFYSRVIVATTGPTCYPEQIMTDMEYPIWPEAIYDALMDVAAIGKPIYITENGLSDASDTHRPNFIRDYLTAVHDAIAHGYDVRGYYHWTLMDNFEWQEGFTKKFGLYEVDFSSPNKTRIPRESALFYRDFVQVAHA